MKGAVAAGHSETATCAADILRDGGNAFDAVVAAHLVACVSEPVLSSLGGGGFLLAKKSTATPVLYDFFAQTPLEKSPETTGSFYKISADFGTVTQDFRIGPGSVAVPGTVKGLFNIHEELCTMPLSRLAEPAITLARNGVEMNAFQADIFRIVKPIYEVNSEVKKHYSNQISGGLFVEGELFKRPLFADFLENLHKEGSKLFYEGEIAKAIREVCSVSGGHITAKDLRNYRVIKRNPIRSEAFNHTVYINPPPSSGGILVAFALKLCEKIGIQKHDPWSIGFVKKVAEVQRIVNKARLELLLNNQGKNPDTDLLDEELLEIYRNEVLQNFSSERGTTHISVADGNGNLAALTTSNGEGSGVMIPGTSIMLNNMLGESDLFPGGMGSWTPNCRISSMMAPGLLQLDNGTEIVFGSGGSNRIRTAILQVLLKISAYEIGIEDAVNHPRIHIEEEILNIEGGFDRLIVEQLKNLFTESKIWQNKSLFFGGVHVVSRSSRGEFTGCGDPRRGGIFMTVE